MCFLGRWASQSVVGLSRSNWEGGRHPRWALRRSAGSCLPGRAPPKRGLRGRGCRALPVGGGGSDPCRARQAVTLLLSEDAGKPLLQQRDCRAAFVGSWGAEAQAVFPRVPEEPERAGWGPAGLHSSLGLPRRATPQNGMPGSPERLACGVGAPGSWRWASAVMPPRKAAGWAAWWSQHAAG